MSWVQLEVALGRKSLPRLEELEERLIACGALALTLLSDDDEPVLEPAPGEMPLWRTVRLRALFPLAVDFAEVRSELASVSPDLRSPEVQFLGEKNWQGEFAAIESIFAERLLLRPPASPEREGLANLVLQPGLAFGSGTHPTTRMCLEWIATHVGTQMSVLDYGCGSGILAIAAVLLGADAVAVDHDQQALTATRNNARQNRLDGAKLRVLDVPGWHEMDLSDRYGVFDVVVANILAGPLAELAEEFQGALKPGGNIVLSGILSEQAAGVMAAYPSIEFDAPGQEEGWVCLSGKHRPV